jgi:NitT/TauT family transport system substrate-binding protein
MHGSPTKLLVRKTLLDSGKVTSVSDLRGMRVGMAGGPGSGGEYLAAKALERGGLTIRDVHIIRMSNPDMVRALESGSIDAGILGSPFADQATESGKAATLAQDLTPGAMTVAFVGSGKFLSERPEAAKRFVLALMEAARMMQGSDYLSPENLKAYLAHVPTTAKALESGVPVVYDPNLGISLDGLRDVERIHRQDGRLEYSNPINLDSVTNTSFVNWALSKLGRK